MKSPDPELEELRKRISRYRRGRHPRARLPAELWAQAATVAKKLGPYRAARELGVSYESLRRKAEGGESSGFVELTGAQLLDAAGGTVVEVTDAVGTRVTMRLPGQALDVAAVVAAFRRTRR